MEHSTLHQEKIQILSRLIKESTLTLEEALVLLQEEKEQPAPVSTPGFMPGITTISPQPYFGTGIIPLSGTVNVANGTGVSFMNNTTSTYTPSTPLADLNT